jgi:hypothetical protein
VSELLHFAVARDSTFLPPSGKSLFLRDYLAIPDLARAPSARHVAETEFAALLSFKKFGCCLHNQKGFQAAVYIFFDY